MEHYAGVVLPVRRIVVFGAHAPATMIEGAFAARVGGVGAYTMINDLLYLELTAYRTLAFSQQNSLGMDPFDGPGLFGGIAPYWRVALEPHWGSHSLMVGTFGMYLDVHPWLDPSFVTWTTAIFPQSDKFTDIGFDTQYQYQGDNYWLTFVAAIFASFSGSTQVFANVCAVRSNPTNLLNSMKLQASFAYGGDNRIVFTGQYFNLWGTADANPVWRRCHRPGCHYAQQQRLDGRDRLHPVRRQQMVGWPWFNARIGLQYIYYNKFDGTTVGAQTIIRCSFMPGLPCRRRAPADGESPMRKLLFFHVCGARGDLFRGRPSLPICRSRRRRPSLRRFSWTGCYLGGHLGGGFGRKDITDPV